MLQEPKDSREDRASNAQTCKNLDELRVTAARYGWLTRVRVGSGRRRSPSRRSRVCIIPAQHYHYRLSFTYRYHRSRWVAYYSVRSPAHASGMSPHDTPIGGQRGNRSCMCDHVVFAWTLHLYGVNPPTHQMTQIFMRKLHLCPIKLALRIPPSAASRGPTTTGTRLDRAVRLQFRGNHAPTI